MNTDSSASKINSFMSFESFNDERQIGLYLAMITGYRYSVATMWDRYWGSEEVEEEGTFYQIMPDSLDDGFFDWYCDERPYNQFFKSLDAAVIHFVFFWSRWKKTK